MDGLVQHEMSLNGLSAYTVSQDAVLLSNLMQIDVHPMSRPVDAEIKRVTVTLPQRQLDALQMIASREDVSVAWLVRKAVDKLLREGPDMPVTNPAQPSRRRK